MRPNTLHRARCNRNGGYQEIERESVRIGRIWARTPGSLQASF